MNLGRRAVGNDAVAQMLDKIGQILAQDALYPLDETLLYAQLDTNMVGPSIFKDRGDHILYRISSDGLTYPLLDLWEEAPPGKRWAEMEYLVRNGKFEVTFVYPDQIDRNEDELERRDRIVKRYFGDKPIVYPDISAEDDVFEF